MKINTKNQSTKNKPRNMGGNAIEWKVSVEIGKK